MSPFTEDYQPVNELQQRFENMLPRFYGTINHPNNYKIVESFFEEGTEAQKCIILQKIKNRVLQLSLQYYSCFVIRKALQTVSLEKKLEIATELNGHIIMCSEHVSGYLIVQTCIEELDPNLIKFIYKPIIESVSSLCIHKYGHYVITAIMRFGVPEYTTPIFNYIYENLYEIVKTALGVKIFQRSILYPRPEYKSLLTNKIRSKLLELSQNPTSSNIIFNCIEASPDIRKILIDEVITFTDDRMRLMLTDWLAHHVLIAMMSRSEPVQSEFLISKITPHLDFLTNCDSYKCLVKYLDTKQFTPGVQECNLKLSFYPCTS